MKKSSKQLTRKVLCGLMAASVLGVCGSAMAAEYTDQIRPGTYTDDAFVLQTKNVSYAIDVTANNPITITSKTISITAEGDGSKDIHVLGADVWSGDKLTLGGDSTESIIINARSKYKGDAVKFVSGIYAQGVNDTSTVVVTANSLKIDVAAVNGSAFAMLAQHGDSATKSAESITVNADSVELSVSSDEAKQGYTTAGIASILSNSTVEINAKTLAVEAKGTADNTFAVLAQNNTEATTASKDAASITLNADTINLTSDKIGIAAFSNGQVNVTGDTTITAEHIIDVRGYSTTNINTDGEHKTVLNGDVVFETPQSGQNAAQSGKLVDAYVNIGMNGEDSVWTGRSYQINATDGESVELPADDTTGLKLTMTDGASWQMTGDSFANTVTVADGSQLLLQKEAETFNVNKLTLNDGSVSFEGSEETIHANTLSGTGGVVNVEDLSNKLLAGSKDEGASITIQSTGAIADEINSGKLSGQELANVVAKKDDTTYSLADTVVTEEGEIAGVYTAKVADGKIVEEQQAVNSANQAIANMAGIELMTWRQENNDMNKRLGELRDSKGEHGVWARMARGESKYGAQNVKNQYNYYQIGYDEKLSSDPSWTVGVALTRTEGTSSFNGGSGENDHTGAVLYGSHLTESGSFVDLVARYARLEHEYKAVGGIGNGDYSTNGYSISAEYGKRFTQDSGFWFEPQAELTYAKVGSVDYISSKGAQVRHEGMDSVVGRLGFALGQNVSKGNVYLRASYLYDFAGDTDIIMSKNGSVARFEQDLGGGWWEVGVGANINLSEATKLYLDLEKTYGGDVATPWQWNAGLRWSF